jgi:glycosyltransferase involved in cell wall biosynthesis
MKQTTQKLIVISSFPRKGEVHGPFTVGVASYAKNTLLNLVHAIRSHNQKPDITVLAEILNQDPATAYLEAGIRVERIWKRGDILSLFNIVKALFKQPAGTRVLIEFEFALFGSPVTAGFLPVILAVAKLRKLDVSIVLHQVVRDITDMSDHIGLDRLYWKIDLVNAALALFYRFIGTLSDRMIVFEQAFADILKKQIPEEKITVIPHGVEPKISNISKSAARDNLNLKPNDFVILAFGYIAAYKGTEWLARYISAYTGNKNVRLIIAGGSNPNHLGKPYYDRYIENVYQTARESDGKVSVTGYIPEKKIPEYYAAADVAVFPYTTLMSSSGPLSIAAAYGLPILISNHMDPMFKTKDLELILEKTGLDMADFSFSMENGGFAKLLKNTAANNKLIFQLKQMSKEITHSRSFKKIGKRYFEVLCESHNMNV